MTVRRKAREFALQSLYALELGQGDLSDVKEAVIAGLGAGQEDIKYGTDLIRNVLEHVPEIDDYISQHMKNWSFERIAIIDKILMRCSIAEMLYMKNIPVKVSITEAIQIAGKYSTEESAVFINGILDAFARELSIA
jgi:N utilization substance protein B